MPVGGERSPLDLFILIDEAARPSLGSQLGYLREFIHSLPRKTAVGVGYMRNGTVQIAQELTIDHQQAANALRMPYGSPGVFGSPYLSAIDLMNRWPETQNRREIVMITDGIDRLHGWPHRRGFGPISPDVSTASATVLRPWYVLGPGHWWPYLLVPMYKLAELLPQTRDGAMRLGLVTLEQMLSALTFAVENPVAGTRVLSVPEIRTAKV